MSRDLFIVQGRKGKDESSVLDTVMESVIQKGIRESERLPKVLTVESGGVTAVLEWKVSFTILNWLHILWLTLNLMLWVVTFVRKHEVTWLAVVTTSIMLAGILGGATKLAIYLDLKAAVSVLESDVVRTGNYESEMHSQLGKL